MRSRPRARHGNLKTALIDSAVMLIAEKGVEALSVAEITRRLGVSGSLPYQHFATRQVLLAATAAQTGRQLAKDMRAAVEKSAHRPDCDATDALAATAAAYVRFIARHRVGFDFIFATELTALHRRELVEAGRAVIDVLLPLVMAVAEDPRTAIRLLEHHITAVHGLGTLHAAGFIRGRSAGIDALAADAAQLTRILAAAAAQHKDTSPSMDSPAVAS